jgi:hypothetical protein
MTAPSAREIVTLAVRSGCFDKATIADMIDDFGDDDAKLRALAKRLTDEKRTAESGWTVITTNDRITRAFAELRRNGIVALENAGYGAPSTHDEGWEAVIDEGTSFDEPPHGAVFYCGADLAGGLAGKGLALTVGALAEVTVANGTTLERRPPTAELAHEICDVLARHDVAASWNGTAVVIAPFRWQRRAFTKAPKPVSGRTSRGSGSRRR